MKNITLAIDDEVVAAGRAYAARHQTTLNQLVRDLLEQTVMPNRDAAVEALRRSWENSSLRLNGWKWNREDVYKGRI